MSIDSGMDVDDNEKKEMNLSVAFVIGERVLLDRMFARNPSVARIIKYKDEILVYIF